MFFSDVAANSKKFTRPDPVFRRWKATGFQSESCRETENIIIVSIVAHKVVFVCIDRSLPKGTAGSSGTHSATKRARVKEKGFKVSSHRLGG